MPKVAPVKGSKTHTFSRPHTVPFSDTEIEYTWTAAPAVCILADGLGHAPFTVDNASWSPKDGLVDVDGKTVIAPRLQDTLEMARFVATDGNMYVMGWHDDESVQANIGGFIDEIVVPTIIHGIDDAVAVPVGPSLVGSNHGIDGAICLSGNIIALEKNGTVLASDSAWASTGTATDYWNEPAYVTAGGYLGTQPTVFGWDRATVVGCFDARNRTPASKPYAQSGTIFPSVDYTYNYMAEAPANIPRGFIDNGITWHVGEVYFSFDREKGIVGILDGGDMIVDAFVSDGTHSFHVLVRLPHTGYDPAHPTSSNPSVFRNLSNGTSGLLSEATNHLPSPIVTGSTITLAGQDQIVFLRPGFANGKQYSVSQRPISAATPAAPGLGTNDDALDTTFVPDLWEFNGTTGALTYCGEFSQSVLVDTISASASDNAFIDDVAFADDGAGTVLIALRFSTSQHGFTIHAYRWDGTTLTKTGEVLSDLGGAFANYPNRRGEGSNLVRFGKTLAYTLTPITRGPVVGPGSQQHVSATAHDGKVNDSSSVSHIRKFF